MRLLPEINLTPRLNALIDEIEKNRLNAIAEKGDDDEIAYFQNLIETIISDYMCPNRGFNSKK